MNMVVRDFETQPADIRPRHVVEPTSSRSMMPLQSRQTRWWCWWIFGSNRAEDPGWHVLATNPSRTRVPRMRYTLIREIAGASARTMSYTWSAVGWSSRSRIASKTARRCVVTGNPRLRCSCSNRSRPKLSFCRSHTSTGPHSKLDDIDYQLELQVFRGGRASLLFFCLPE